MSKKTTCQNIGEVVLFFGAGASFGSDKALQSYDSTRLPPLGKNLYKALCDFEPKLWKQIDTLFDVYEDFEKGWETIQKSLSIRDLRLLLQSMARFFNQFDPSEVNLYRELARKISNASHWNGCFISLNYEALLQKSLQYESVPYNIEVTGYVYTRSDNPIEICVPHGYIHVYMNLRGFEKALDFESYPINYFQTENMDNPVWMADRYCVPILSYYTIGKRTNFGNEYIDLQKKRYKDIVKNAKKILIIGVAFNQHDTHIWEPLAKTNSSLFYFEPFNLMPFRQWADTLPNRDLREIAIIEETFESGFTKICQIAELGDGSRIIDTNVPKDALEKMTDAKEIVKKAIFYETQLHDINMA
ncbi:MAG: hypothetical protein JSV88_19090, partial [Candidatus Aminicenantes bacterium]